TSHVTLLSQSSSIVYSYVYVHAQSVLFAPGVVFVTVTVRSTSQLSVYSASTSSSRLLGSKSPSHRFWLIRSRLLQSTSGSNRYGSPVSPPLTVTSHVTLLSQSSSIVYSYVYVHAQSVLFAPGVVFVTVTVRSTSQLSVYSASTSSS